jgi:hypothetical protein
MAELSLTDIINLEAGLALPAGSSLADLRQQLQAAISEMISANFQQLVNLLYRVDVNERKLKYLLQENVGEDAAAIIAGLIIDRQLEKIASRRQFKNDGPVEDDEERW